ncbi:YbcC family protein [Roseomonas sp. CCTCC AB2023176]|uniref:YbcC family protein n=1 Tax=Roseomonas sp. CCTCC AB2023176 TaxID=3342640 RepID=UPI0035E1420D
MPDISLSLPVVTLEDRVRRACARVAPLWPLRDFVAVNPFLGLAEQDFAQAAATLRWVAGKDLLPSRAHFAEAVADGRVAPRDFAAAGADPSVLDAPRPAPEAAPAALTVADVLDATLGTAWARFATDEISKWAADWADEGQAAWPMPWRHLPFYAAWRAAIRHDLAPEVAGLRGFRAAVASLPEEPVESIAASLRIIGLPQAEADDYLHRALLSVAGWAGMLRQRGWASELAGGTDDGVLNILAVRLAWDAALFVLHEDARFREAWAARLAAAPAASPDLTPDLALLEASEVAFRRRVIGRFAAEDAPRARPLAQAVFCIDVRSEVYRRALEAVAPEVETLGFAGFFGFSLDYVRFGEATGVAQCPVLLSPAVTICEGVAGASPAEEAAALSTLRVRRRIADLWTAFRTSAVSCFAYVETAGLASVVGLARGVLRRPEPEGDVLARLAPEVAPRPWRGRNAGLPTLARIEAAETVLRAMSLTRDFGGLVLLVGHGATTVNNPHAAGLDCGACGGHTGESNARVAAGVLNDPLVREALVDRGIAIPADTWFLAGLHDTVTDEVRLFDADRVPPSQADALATLQEKLAAAGRRARHERAPSLGLSIADPVTTDTRRRTADWSEVRPEWALANNAAFVAAPRWRTAGMDLGGRSFLHSYDWRADRGFGVLELIMTAPMVVANWINLQYYGSTVDNDAWGSGNKTLHNVVGLTGVLEGQGGDLRAGLPMQSVHDGKRFVHEPLRLSVFIEAPEAEMDRILAKHAGVRQLVENGWLHLLSIRDDGSFARRRAAGEWAAEG